MQTYFDWPYAVFYILLMFFALSYNKHQKLMVAISIAVVFVFVAFRAPVVGADTFRYVCYLTGETSLNSIVSAYNRGDIEWFFLIYGEVIRFITSSRFWVMIINNAIAFTPVFVLYKNYSFNPPLSFLLFFFLNCTNVYFIGLRQILGFSFVLWALLYFLKNKEYNNISDTKESQIKNIRCFVYLMISIVIGYLFHSSIIIYGVIIIFWLFVPLKSRLLASSLILVSFVFGVVLQRFDISSTFNWVYIFISDISDSSRLADYFINSSENGINGTFSLFKISFLGLISVIFMEKEKLNHIFTKLFLTGIIFFNLFLTIPMLDRFNSVFYMFGGVVFTWIYTKRNDNNQLMILVKRVMSIFILLYFTLYGFVSLGRWDRMSDSKMHPYYFIFQDYPNHE